MYPFTRSDFWHGLNADIDDTAEQICEDSRIVKIGVLVVAHKDNAGIVYVGKEGVKTDATPAFAGIPLAAGDSVVIEVDNLNKVYVIASQADQKAFFLAI